MASQSGSLMKALRRGFMMKCPHCGKGRLFGRYLKVVDYCASCGEAFHHHQADDYPAYLVIAVVGHAVFPIVLALDAAFMPPLWTYTVFGFPVVIASVLGALQPTKGAVVALQWQLGMFGFEKPRHKHAMQPTP